MIFLIILCVLAIGGRIACSTICPLGRAQELLFKIPFSKKLKFKKLPHEEHLKKIKYFIFCALLIIIPLNIVYHPELDKTVMLWVKISAFSLVFLLSLFIYRPFCKYLCPIGVFLGIFNKYSLSRYKVDDSCIKCGVCKKTCDMGLMPYANPNSVECIRCGKCMKKCPKHSITYAYFKAKEEEKNK